MDSLDEKPGRDQIPSTGKEKNKTVRFSHQAEETFATILDYYGIEWQYEPRSFSLAQDERGNIIEAFTPDFYLPQQDMYIELTTLRPHLTSRKNRKIRQLKELYPEINIKLFKRTDLRQLMVKYGLDNDAGKISGSDAQER